jgi:hypothetical protein
MFALLVVLLAVFSLPGLTATWEAAGELAP